MKKIKDLLEVIAVWCGVSFLVFLIVLIKIIKWVAIGFILGIVIKTVLMV